MRHPEPRSAHTASRTCVGCRRRDDRSMMVRVVVERDANGRYAVVPDPRRRLPGRGAWLHPRPECLERAVRRTAFGRALRVTAQLDLDAVGRWVERAERTAQDNSTEQDSTEQDSGRQAGARPPVSRERVRRDEHPMSTL